MLPSLPLGESQAYQERVKYQVSTNRIGKARNRIGIAPFHPRAFFTADSTTFCDMGGNVVDLADAAATWYFLQIKSQAVQFWCSDVTRFSTGKTFFVRHRGSKVSNENAVNINRAKSFRTRCNVGIPFDIYCDE